MSRQPARDAKQFLTCLIPHCLSLLLLLNLSGCASVPARLTSSGLNSTFSLTHDQSYAEYLDLYRDIVAGGRLDLNNSNRQKVLAANEPYELLPDPEIFPPDPQGRWSRGIILIHGLTDSPYMLRAQAEYFRSRGWLVRGILLPGHGTRPGDLAEVNLEDWRQSLAFAAADTAPLVRQLYLGGFSLGGALAVDYAMTNHGSISGLFLYTPCLRVKSSFSWLAPVLGLFKTWLEIHDDSDYAKYESFALNGGIQVMRLTTRIKARASRRPGDLDLPVFTALSLEDETVDSRYTLDFFHRYFSHPASRLLLYSADRNPTLPPDRRITVVESFIPSRKILSFSHLSITLPPEDPHYGENGDYRNCLHYPDDSGESARCRAGEASWLGEKTPANLETGLLQRLSWNARYNLQIEELDRFLTTLD